MYCNKCIPIIANKCIHIITTYFLAAASDKCMCLLTSLYGILVGRHYQWIPKGLIQVLTERVHYRRTMKPEDMKKEITIHPDFKNGKIQFLGDLYTSVDMLFCLYQSTTVSSERCWSQAQRHTRVYCNYSIIGLRQNILEAFNQKY